MAKKIHPAKVLRSLKTKGTPEQVKKARAQKKRVDEARNSK
jgi:hypothetical protein